MCLIILAAVKRNVYNFFFFLPMSLSLWTLVFAITIEVCVHHFTFCCFDSCFMLPSSQKSHRISEVKAQNERVRESEREREEKIDKERYMTNAIWRVNVDVV